MRENEIASKVVETCLKVHRVYGPGLFETVYESVFCHEWAKLDIPFVRQRGVRLIHEDVDMGIAFIPDIVIADEVIIEMKSVQELGNVFFKQLLTYLRITDTRLGLLINFNVPLIKNGIHREVNRL